MVQQENKKQRLRRGIVVSDKGDKTAVAVIQTLKTDPLYKKRIRWSKKYMFHDEKNECTAGDIVDIIPCRPYSRKKRYKLHKLVTKAEKD
ncbi:MAG TPA: 30S ribosomal protein S17 [Spirochaetota bacterium]|nr:30S ribosomal protein S17 [Spirochaetota bacterium]